MHPFRDQVITAAELILKEAVETLTTSGVPVDEAKARVLKRFEFLNRHAGTITVDALCVPLTNI